MTFSVAQQYLASGGLTPGDLRNPKEVLYTGGTDAFQSALSSNALTQMTLAQAGLGLQGQLALRDKELAYSREYNDQVAEQNRRTTLLNLATGLGAAGAGRNRMAYDKLQAMGISLPSANPVEIANQYADWNRYFTSLTNAAKGQAANSTLGTGLMTKKAIEQLGGGG